MIKQQKTLADTLNDAPLSSFHLRIVVVVGMGFFTDAYSLFIIGPALSLLKPQWHPNALEAQLLSSVALLASFIGAIVFGRIADRVGRRAIYGWQMLAIALLTLVTAFAPEMVTLIIVRGLLGFVIGGNYPVTAVLVSEYANRKDRGRLVGMAFSMQALALVAGPLITLAMLGLNLPTDLAWRLMLGLAIVPALTAFVLRRSLPESPRFVSRVRGDTATAADQLRAYSKGRIVAPRASEGLRTSARLSHYILPLIGTAGTWFLFDYAYYGNTLSTPLIIKAVAPEASLITSTYWTLMIFLVAAVPGYVLAFNTVDRIGRKRMQIIGFICMGLAFLGIGMVPGITQTVVPFLLIFSTSYFFAEFGPNTTTFMLAAELFPVNQRATSHGIAAGIAKLGAFISVFLFQFIQSNIGLSGALDITCLFSFLGCLLTLVLSEPAGRSLEEASGEDVQQQNPMVASPAWPGPVPQKTVMNLLPRLPKAALMALIVLTFLLVVSGIGLFSLVHANQIATENAHATATTAAFNATNTALVNDVATTDANAASTTTSLQNVYNNIASRTPTLNDPLRDNSKGYSWDEGPNSYGGNCAFAGGVYHVSQANTYYSEACAAASTDFSNFVFEVQMKIIKGDGGGVIFRADTSGNNYYVFGVTQDGFYEFYLCAGNACDNPLKFGPSSAIKQGLNQTNLIAVLAQGSTIWLYVNHQLIASVDDSTYSSGQIGVGAFPESTANGHPTEVVYSNAKVWTV